MSRSKSKSKWCHQDIKEEQDQGLPLPVLVLVPLLVQAHGQAPVPAQVPAPVRVPAPVPARAPVPTLAQTV